MVLPGRSQRTISRGPTVTGRIRRHRPARQSDAGSAIYVGTEPANWQDYWDAMTTQLAGNNPPDLMQQDYQYLKEYVDNGALLALVA